MPRNKRGGAEAEDLASSFLQSKGYTIVTRNYHARVAEIDIVALDGDTVVFVEVRERKAGSFLGPEESVTSAKRRKLWQAAGIYLSEVVGKEADARFDVIAVHGSDVRHHVDAFRPET